jgi:tetratricopeptide (TPR) repeat protein
MLELDRPGAPGHRAGRLIKSVVGIVVVCTCLTTALLFLRPGADPAKIRLLANRAAQAGRWDQAKSQLDRLSDPNPGDWLLRAIAAYNLNRLDAAEEALRSIPDDGPLAAQAALWKGRVELSRFRARPMEEALRRALKLDSSLVEARRLLVYLYGTQGRRQDLLEQFTALSKITPLTFELINHWCISHNDILSEPLTLKKDLEKFVAADPGDRWSRIALATNERKLRNFDEADKILGRLRESDPDVLACRVEVAFDRGDYAVAERLLAVGPRDHAQLARQRGRLALHQGDRQAALIEYRLSDAMEPNQSETAYGLMQSLPVGDPCVAELNRRRQAQRKLNEMLATIEKQRLTKVQLCHELGALCEASAYLPEADAWYRLAITLDPMDREAQQAVFRLGSAEALAKARSQSANSAH